MFSPDIVCSDAFLDMPSSSRDLYYQLGMYADDDGFVNPRKIMRMTGSSEDDLKILIAKRFVLTFENGVVVIKHWLIHNLIRADLYKETLYKQEKSNLGLNDNGAYTELREGVSPIKQIEAPKWLKIRRGELRTANVPQTARRLGKVRLGKDTLVEQSSTPKTFNWKEYLKSMVTDKKKHIRVIAYYFARRQLEFFSHEQVAVAITRHLKAAASVSKFSREQITAAMDRCEKKYTHGREEDKIDWTLETVVKELTK